MGATTKISFEEFLKLQDADEGTASYELDEGELLLTPSPTGRHNIVRYRLRRVLTDFVAKNHLGLVLDETDFRLSENTVRKPDAAFIAKPRIKSFDFDRSPLEGAPTLAIEVISPSNLAQDTVKKVRQYRAAGCQAVWLVYPGLQFVEIHDAAGVREVTVPRSIQEERLFPGFSFEVSLAELFEEDLEK